MTDEHAGYDELAVGWALHALEPEDEAVFTAHLGGCERCAGTVAGTTEAMAAMATDLPQAEPSDELRQRLRRAVEQTEQLPPPAAPVPAPAAPVPAPAAPVPAPAAPGPAPATVRVRSALGPGDDDVRPRRRRLLPALAAAAVAAVVGLGVWNVVLVVQRHDLQSTVAAQRAVMDALQDPHRAILAPQGDAGRPVATVVPRGGEVDVVAHGLAANDAVRTTYVVWGLRGSEPVALGTFDVVGSRMRLQTVGSGLTGLDQFDGYAVSLEPGHKAPSAPTDVVAIGQVTS